jgi:signal recognition particle receptor subunit beta
MSAINYASKEIYFKIVYYGPGMGGKTTNLQYVHQAIPQANKGDLVSLATDQDRTLFFDFLPVEAIQIHGFTTKFQLYTVPGQVHYNATRKLVLRGVDGVVFVADSQWEKMQENVESFRNLEENLTEYDYSFDEIPYVLQYNKRDLASIAPVEYMDYLLNRRATRVSTFESVATAGQGVFDTLNRVAKLVLHKLSREMEARTSSASRAPTAR